MIQDIFPCNFADFFQIFLQFPRGTRRVYQNASESYGMLQNAAECCRMLRSKSPKLPSTQSLVHLWTPTMQLELAFDYSSITNFPKVTPVVARKIVYGNFGLFGYGRTRTGTAKNNSRTPYYFVASVFDDFQCFTDRFPWVLGHIFQFKYQLILQPLRQGYRHGTSTAVLNESHFLSFHSTLILRK